MLRKQSQAVGVVTPDFQVAVKLLVCVRVMSVVCFFIRSCLVNQRLLESLLFAWARSCEGLVEGSSIIPSSNIGRLVIILSLSSGSSKTSVMVLQVLFQ